MNSKQLRNAKEIKPILKMIKQLGGKVRFIQEAKSMGYFDAYGVFEAKNNTISVCTVGPRHGKMNIEDIAFVLAHEYRHLEHVKKKRFLSYYNKSIVKDIKLAHRAELDCDSYGRRYVNKYCDRKSRLCYRKYPISKCSGYYYHKIKEFSEKYAHMYGGWGKNGYYRAKHLYLLDLKMKDYESILMQEIRKMANEREKEKNNI